MLKKKDGLLIALVLVLALCLVGISRVMPKTDLNEKKADVTLAPDAIEYLEPTPELTTEPAQEPTAKPEQETQQSVAAGPMPMPQTDEIRGYVVITVGTRQYGDPIAMDRDKVITVKQEDGKINKIHITPDSVYMESSTCDNQDCVGQGTISLENYKKRILGTYVICLPNQVTIEMVPAE